MGSKFEENLQLKQEIFDPLFDTFEEFRHDDLKASDYPVNWKSEELPYVKAEMIQIRSEVPELSGVEYVNIKMEPCITSELHIKEEGSMFAINEVPRDKCDLLPENKKPKRNRIIKRNRDHLKCSVCGYIGAERRALQKHLQTHTGERPFKCNECHYSSIQKIHLIEHLRVHTGEKPYKCNECEFSTAWKYCLKMHLRSHNDDKPFKCFNCDYRSPRKTDLQKHVVIHTGERPYQCTQCNYKAYRNYHLKSHMRVHNKRKLLD